MSRRIIKTFKAPKPIGAYSQAIMVKNTLYISGQIGLDAKINKMIKDNIISEIDQVMRNISYILQEAEMSFINVVKCSIFMKNLGDFQLINSTYEKYFMDNPPARETVEVSNLPSGANVEISCIAVA